jgi:putative nucleotidyltransferase with HDIG domain
MTPATRIDLGGRADLLRDLATFFGGRGVDVWATGGFLRDAILGTDPHDIDLAVAGDPLTLGPELAAALAGHFFPLREERAQARILLPERHVHVDLMPLRAPDIEGDLRMRDFTIDAMAVPLSELSRESPNVIDPTGGLADLDRRLVRMTGERAFADDPLRLLRGPRIATQLAFEIEPATREAIQRLVPTITEAAQERQRDEIARICASERAGAGFRLLDDLGLFMRVLPEMEPTRGVDQPTNYHYYDVLGHSFAAVEALDWLLSETRPESSPQDEMWDELWRQLEWCGGLREYFRDEVVPGTSRRTLLKLCALLHDIAKPQTKTFEESGRMRFFGHSEKGAEMATRLMQRLRFSSREIRLVAAMINAHLRPVQLGEQRAPSRKAVYRFFRDTKDAGVETLLLSLGDHLGSVGPRVNRDGFRAHVTLISYILHLRFGEEQVVSPPRLVDGDVLMASLGLEPGPTVGALLEAIREAQAAGEVTTADGAIALARARLAEGTALGAE